MASTRIGGLAALVAVAGLALVAQAADNNKHEFKYTVGPKASVTIVNEFGSVSVRGVSGRVVTITATTHSDNLEIDSKQAGNRTEARTHILKRVTPEEGKVEYEVTVPMDASVSVRGSTGPFSAQKLHGDLLLEGDGARVDVSDVSGAHVHVRTMDGPVTLSNISAGHVEVSSVGGDVELNNVTGPKVSVNTTDGNIRYTGDFGGNGDYALTNSTGDIEVSLPTTASVDLTARSIKGSAVSSFPFTSQPHTTFPILEGRSIAGTANHGASSVRLRSLSGTIRVTKQH